MSLSLAIRVLFALLFGLAIAWAVYSGNDDELAESECGAKRERYRPIVAATALPGVLIGLWVISFAALGAERTFQEMLGICLNVFLELSVYYLILIPLLPLLRRWLSARTCALLWVLPTYLYFGFYSSMRPSRPLLVLRTHGSWVWVVFGIWLAGALGVFLWKTIAHFCYRRHILRRAEAVTDTAVLALWQSELEAAGIRKARFQLVISPDVTAPLTIGLFRRTMRVVLPHRTYAPEELQMVFRHELVHICRSDSSAKLFLVFCTAMCWFNPLMWRAMRSSADDIERSCDETVLRSMEADTAARRRYAELLLAAAGDARGYTTCLSAEADSMRYRLRAVVTPRRGRTGALLVGAVMTALLLSSGYVALSYGGARGESVLFADDRSVWTISSASYESQTDERQVFTIVDEPALRAYLAELECCPMTGSYAFDGYERTFAAYFSRSLDRDWCEIELSDNVLKLVRLFGKGSETRYYYLPAGTDWAYLDTLLIDARLNVHLDRADVATGWNLTVKPERLGVEEDTGERVLVQTQRQSGESPSGIFGPEPETLVLRFSRPLAGPLSLSVVHEETQQICSYTWEPAESGSYLLPVSWTDSARYTVQAALLGADGRVYRAEYVFDVGEMD